MQSQRGARFWEYLDHTADVLVHAWGDVLADCLANGLLATARYMYPEEARGHISHNNVLAAAVSSSSDPEDDGPQDSEADEVVYLEATGPTLHALVYNLFTELLVLSSVRSVAVVDATVVVLDLQGLSATAAAAAGDGLVLAKAPPGGGSAEGDDAQTTGAADVPMPPAAAERRLYAKARAAVLPADDAVAPKNRRAAGRCFSKGTEVKAITKQGMRVALRDEDGLWHLHVVLDI